LIDKKIIKKNKYTLAAGIAEGRGRSGLGLARYYQNGTINTF
jgi:hypothetical protein